MAAPTPKTRGGELIDELNLLAETPENTIALKRAEKEAWALVRVNPVEGYCALGILEGIRQNEEKCREMFGKALDLSKDSVTRLNFAMSVFYLGRFDEAIAAAAEARAEYPNDAQPIEKLMITHDFLGNADTVRALAGAYRALAGVEPPLQVPSAEDAFPEDAPGTLSRMLSRMDGIMREEDMVKPDKALMDFVGELVAGVPAA